MSAGTGGEIRVVHPVSVSGQARNALERFLARIGVDKGQLLGVDMDGITFTPFNENEGILSLTLVGPVSKLAVETLIRESQPDE